MEFFRNLILFSGGIESTALLTIANPQDIILVINPVFTSDDYTYKKSSVEKILEYFKFNPVYANLNFSAEPNSHKFVHQMNIFTSICNVWVRKDPTIKSIWCGRNSKEPSDIIKPLIEELMYNWNVMNPTISFDHPLDHLSKYEQLELIPPIVRKYIHSCIHDIKCGTCYKCKEYTWI